MTYTEIWHALAPVYGSSEAKAVARLLLTTLFGFHYAHRYCQRQS